MTKICILKRLPQPHETYDAETDQTMKYCVLFLFFTLTARQRSQQKNVLPSPDEKYKDLPSFKADKAS